LLRAAPPARLVVRRAQPRGPVAPPLGGLQRRGRPLRRAVAVVDVRGEEQQFAVVGPQLQRLLEDLESLAGAIELLVRPEERPRRPARLLPEAAEAVAQEEQGGGGLAQVPRRDEV